MGARTETADGYDAFISYNSNDRPKVEEIVHRLENEAQLRIFFDHWHLVFGQPWMPAVETALDESRCCLVFVGPSGYGPWQNEEVWGAIQNQVAQREFRVIWVLLEGASTKSLNGFLKNRPGIDFKEIDAFGRLVCGIHGLPPKPNTIAAYLPRSSFYLRKSIFGIVASHLSDDSLNITDLRPSLELTITDVERYCISRFGHRSASLIRNKVFAARRRAYSEKYGGRTTATDERYTDIAGWNLEFESILAKCGVHKKTEKPVLCVGIGNGLEGRDIYRRFKNLTIIDVSEDQLKQAQTQFPHAKAICTEAEVLKDIENESRSLYISLRTYQSTLFDIDAAVLQAHRVLRSKGWFIASVPYKYIVNQSLLTGLPHPGSTRLDEELPYVYCDKIRRSLAKLSIENIAVHTGLFEVYVIGQRA